jgi:hypothetical protein
MIARKALGLAALLVGTHAACGGGSPNGADAALPETTTYFSCDETYSMGPDTIVHSCLEYSQEAPFHTPSPNQCTPTANGYMGKPGNGLSTTKPCPTTEPGCVCSHDEEPGHHHYEDYQYQTETEDGYRRAALLCKGFAGGTVSCFGGLTVPADAGTM